MAAGGSAIAPVPSNSCARQLAKDAVKEQEHQTKELRGQIGALQTVREHLRQEVQDVRAAAVRGQLEGRLNTESASALWCAAPRKNIPTQILVPPGAEARVIGSPVPRPRRTIAQALSMARMSATNCTGLAYVISLAARPFTASCCVKATRTL